MASLLAILFVLGLLLTYLTTSSFMAAAVFAATCAVALLTFRLKAYLPSKGAVGTLVFPEPGASFAQEAPMGHGGEVLVPFHVYKKLRQRILGGAGLGLIILLLLLLGLKTLPVPAVVLFVPAFVLITAGALFALWSIFSLLPTGQRLSTLKHLITSDPRAAFATYAPKDEQGALTVGYTTYKRLYRTAIIASILLLALVSASLYREVSRARLNADQNLVAALKQFRTVAATLMSGQGDIKEELMKLAAQSLEPAPGLDENSLANRIISQVTQNLPDPPTQIVRETETITVEKNIIHALTKEVIKLEAGGKLVFEDENGTDFVTFGGSPKLTINAGGIFNIEGQWQVAGVKVETTAAELNRTAKLDNTNLDDEGARQIGIRIATYDNFTPSRGDLEAALRAIDTAIGNAASGASANFTAGSVVFADSSGFGQDNINFFWDDTNNRLGVGTATPRAALDVTGDVFIENSTNLNISNPDFGYGVSNMTATGDGFHTVINGRLNGTSGGTGNLVIGGSITADTTGSNFNTAIGPGSSTFISGSVSNNTVIGRGANLTNVENSTAIGYNASVAINNAIALGDSNARVAIGGDTSPDASLEIVNDGSGDSFLVADTNDGDTTPFVIQSDGDVGIGTGSPGAKVEVLNAGTDAGIFVNQDGNGNAIRVDSESTTADVVDVDATTTTTGDALQISVDTDALVPGGSGAALRIRGTSTGTTDVLTVDGAGHTKLAGNFTPTSNATLTTTSRTLTTVDATGAVGDTSSIAIGTDGYPVVSYRDATTAALKVVKCGNAACSSGSTLTTVDTGINIGLYTSIAIGTDGLPVVSYYDQTNTDLKVVKCGNAACSSGNTTTTVDSTGNVGQSTSLAIGTDGLPVVSYQDTTNADLKVAKCGNAACSSGNTLTTVDDTFTVGLWTSIAIGTDGLPVVSYRDATNQDLKVAKCGNAACSAGNTLTTVDSTGSIGESSSIAIGTDGLPVVSYRDATNQDLKVAKCGNAACSSGNTTTIVDSTGDVGQYTSLAIGTDGYPVVSYRDATNLDLKVAKCGNAACSSGNTTTTVDSTGNVGINTSLAIGTDGLPVVSYYDSTNGDLKVARCVDAACASASADIYTGGQIAGAFKGNQRSYGPAFEIVNAFEIANPSAFRNTIFSVNGVDQAVLTATGNFGLGTASFGTSAAKVLAIGNGTAPTASIANGIQLYAEDVTASSELKVRDEAGNITTLSPHNFSLFNADENDYHGISIPWSFYSRNDNKGQEINVDMLGAVQAIETLSGHQFVYAKDTRSGGDIITNNRPEVHRALTPATVSSLLSNASAFQELTARLAVLEGKVAGIQDRLTSLEAVLSPQTSALRTAAGNLPLTGLPTQFLHLVGVEIEELIVEEGLVVHGDVRFLGDVEIGRHVRAGGRDIAGTVTVPAGRTRARIHFEQAFERPPIVIVSGVGTNAMVAVEKTEREYVVISIHGAGADEEVSFNWFAIEPFAAGDARVTFEEETPTAEPTAQPTILPSTINSDGESDAILASPSPTPTPSLKPTPSPLDSPSTNSGQAAQGKPSPTPSFSPIPTTNPSPTPTE